MIHVIFYDPYDTRESPKQIEREKRDKLGMPIIQTSKLQHPYQQIGELICSIAEDAKQLCACIYSM